MDFPLRWQIDFDVECTKPTQFLAYGCLRCATADVEAETVRRVGEVVANPRATCAERFVDQGFVVGQVTGERAFRQDVRVHAAESIDVWQSIASGQSPFFRWPVRI